MLFIFFEIIPV